MIDFLLSWLCILASMLMLLTAGLRKKKPVSSSSSGCKMLTDKSRAANEQARQDREVRQNLAPWQHGYRSV